MNNVVYEALLAGARYKKELERRKINLPAYRCRCYGMSCYPFDCLLCNGFGILSYEGAVKVWGIVTLGMQVPQCHICTRFETEDNPLFAYSYLERNSEFKFIYRCLKGHSHDHGTVLLDVQTNLEVCL